MSFDPSLSKSFLSKTFNDSRMPQPSFSQDIRTLDSNTFSRGKFPPQVPIDSLRQNMQHQSQQPLHQQSHHLMQQQQQQQQQQHHHLHQQHQQQQPQQQASSFQSMSGGLLRPGFGAPPMGLFLNHNNGNFPQFPANTPIARPPVSIKFPLTADMARIASQLKFQQTLLQVKERTSANHIVVVRNEEGTAESINIESSSADIAQLARSLVEMHLKLEIKLQSAENRFLQVQTDLFSTQGQIAAGHVDEFNIDPDLIGLIIGKKGARVNQIKADTGVTSINIADSGVISICGPDSISVKNAREQLEVVEDQCPLTDRQVEWLAEKYNWDALNDLRDGTNLFKVRLDEEQKVIKLVGPLTSVNAAKFLWSTRQEYMDREIDISQNEREARDRLRAVRKQYGFNTYRGEQDRGDHRGRSSRETDHKPAKKNFKSEAQPRGRVVEKVQHEIQPVKHSAVNIETNAIVHLDEASRVKSSHNKESKKFSSDSKPVNDAPKNKARADPHLIVPVAPQAVATSTLASTTAAVAIGAPPGIFKKKEKAAMLTKLSEDAQNTTSQVKAQPSAKPTTTNAKAITQAITVAVTTSQHEGTNNTTIGVDSGSKQEKMKMKKKKNQQDLVGTSEITADEIVAEEAMKGQNNGRKKNKINDAPKIQSEAPAAAVTAAAVTAAAKESMRVADENSQHTEMASDALPKRENRRRNRNSKGKKSGDSESPVVNNAVESATGV